MADDPKRSPLSADVGGMSRPMPERQAFFPVEPIDEVLARGPAFTVEQHAHLPVAVPHSCLSQLQDALPELGARIAIAIPGPRTADRSIARCSLIGYAVP